MFEDPTQERGTNSTAPRKGEELFSADELVDRERLGAEQIKKWQRFIEEEVQRPSYLSTAINELEQGPVNTGVRASVSESATQDARRPIIDTWAQIHNESGFKGTTRVKKKAARSRCAKDASNGHEDPSSNGKRADDEGHTPADPIGKLKNRESHGQKIGSGSATNSME